MYNKFILKINYDLKRERGCIMIIPKKLKKGDTIGVVAPSNPIIGENIEEINKAKDIIENLGFRVKFSKNLFSNIFSYYWV